MKNPEIAILVSTFERPDHLRRCLYSLACQQNVDGRFEVVVTDDGSRDQTAEVVHKFARKAPFSVRYTTHPHQGFRLSLCRNEGTAVSTAPYLLFTDGDCVLPPDHVQWHLAFRTPGMVIAGDCWRIDRETSDRVNEFTIRSQDFLHWIPRNEKCRLRNKAIRAKFYTWLKCRMLPRLTGCNISLWRKDLERINGFDEEYIGWGLEDRDLQRRLAACGLRFRSIVDHTAVCHLWHPPHPTFQRNAEGTANLKLFQRSVIPIRCRCGLDAHTRCTPAVKQLPRAA